MPSNTSPPNRLERVFSQRNLTILTAIIVGVPAAYAFQTSIGGQGSSFLLLLVLAVGVPTAYDEYWPRYDRTATALAWIVGAIAVAGIGYAVLFWVFVSVLTLSEIAAGVGAFLVTTLGPARLLPRWTEEGPA